MEELLVHNRGQVYSYIPIMTNVQDFPPPRKKKLYSPNVNSAEVKKTCPPPQDTQEEENIFSPPENQKSSRI